MKLIHLGKWGKNAGKYFAMVDDEDYELLNQWVWSVRTSINNIYAYRNDYSSGKAVCILMHRFILGVKQTKIQVDHKDHNGLNNQKANLRKCTNSENSRNSRKTKGARSKYIGVHYHKSKYKEYIRGQIMFNRKHIHLGFFKTEEDAALAYDKKAIELFGEFANLNFKEYERI